MKYCPICNAKYEDDTSFCATDGEVLENDPTSIVDSVLDGQYHVEALLGKGGMGAVYRARHILLGDRVAIKVLPPQMRNNAEWLRRFRREGQAARRFRHPNAVTVYDLRTTADGLIYMVMEYVEGHTLDAELKARGRFSPADAFAALEPVMSVLNAAHAQGVVHRDLKPENIMLGKPADGGGSPIVKLLDLGIAKISEVAGSEASGTTALTVAGQVLGTPYYMSPEQWGEVPNDGGSEVDGRADIYSLGAVFYELIAGRKPFMGRTLPDLRREHVSVMPPALNEVMPEVPEGFSRAIMRALSKDRSERQTTAGEVASELHTSLVEAGLVPALGTYGLGQQSAATSSTPTGSTGGGAPAPFSTDLGQARNTNTDINAPTILTLDSPPRQEQQQPSAPLSPAATSYAPPPSPQVGSNPSSSAPPAASTHHNAPPMPTVATNPAAFSASSPAQPPYQQQQSVSYAPTPSYTPAPPAAAAPRRSPVVPIVAGVLGLVLLLGVGGGLLVWSRMGGEKPAEEAEKKNVPAETGKDSKTAPGATTEARETMRYWLEAAGAAPGSPSARVAGTMPLASGQKFKFHLTANEDGYLYIVGPGQGNVPTTFLTAKPVEVSGVETNEAKAGVDFAFPNGDDNWIQLDKTAGTEFWTVIFSPTPLSSPAFLDAEAGSELTEEEQTEFEGFRAQHKANAPATDVINGADPMVSVKVPNAKQAGDPVVFDIRIEHK